MHISEFDFNLPDKLIARKPASPRENARILHIKQKTINDSTIDNNNIDDSNIIADLPDLLQNNDVMVLNDTKVIPARLYGLRGKVKIEILLHQMQDKSYIWSVFARPAKRLRIGNIIKFSDDFSATILEKLSNGEIILEFSDNNFWSKLEKYGHVPLPPYIKRDDNINDKIDYQTCYAKYEGSVAAPTAGLHFTPELLAKISKKGVKLAWVTLHVGAGTFLPVKVENTNDHIMHSEYGEITQETADIINNRKGRLIAVGTTSLRLLESAVDDNGVQPYSENTNIFITPPYNFRTADVLMTNFHLPKSTLFMLVCAFAGMENMKNAYDIAIKENFRFFSYGDSCLLERI